jgi:CRISPR-associated protein Csb2
MLAFGIRYLNGFAAASAVEDRDLPEWPPHPARVFMALVAAHFQTGAEPGERAALCWLEKLESGGQPAAPFIAAPDANPRATVTHYVPVNDDPGHSTAPLQSLALTRARQPRSFARAWLDNDTVFLWWPEAEPDEAIQGALAALCGKVSRIGHSSSLVQMWVAQREEIGEPTWVPDEEGAVIRLRLAVFGTLEYFEQQFNGDAVESFAALQAAEADTSVKKAQVEARKRLRTEYPSGPPPQRRPNLSMSQGYAPPVSDQADRVLGTVFSPHLIAFGLEPLETPYCYLDLGCVLAIVQRWREALLSNSNDLSPAMRAILSGHDADGAPLRGAHLAFLPLAFVGSEHGDGHLLGIALALPRELSRQHRREVLRVIGRVPVLKLGRLGAWRLAAPTASRPQVNLRAETWTAHPRGATHWSTATPIVFDHHPKAKERAEYASEVAAMIRQCCARIDLPTPREAIATPVSAHLGVPPAHEFPRLRRKDGSQRRQSHAILVFDEPVRGPILLGAGRYRGYGVCRPIHGSRVGSGRQ